MPPLKDARVPPELTEEVMCYQQSQLLSTPQFIVQLPQILDLLHRLNSPWAEQARQLVDANSTITSALHTLFLQRWRLSLILFIAEHKNYGHFRHCSLLCKRALQR